MAVAFVAGPAGAFLHEAKLVTLGPRGTLWPLGIVAGTAAAGLIIGFRLGRRVPWPLRAIAFAPNALVLAYYGFFILFFGLGGSR